MYTLYWRSVHLIRLVIKSKFSANTVQNMKPIATNSRVHKVPPKNMADYEAINKWMKFRRRHEENVFNAIFYDQENVTDADITSLVTNVTTFFNLPQPEIKSKCKTFAEVLLNDNTNQCELTYNIEMLKKVGINNKDAFTLCFVHEMAHQILFRHRFKLFYSERWIQELAADLTAGLYAERHHLATGKYKYALSIQKCSITHPDGKLRKEIVDAGRHYLEQRNVNGKTMIDLVIRIMPTFTFTHHKRLKNDWYRLMDELETPPPPPTPEYNIEDLPDSNLIKQAVMKYRKQKEQDNEGK